MTTVRATSPSLQGLYPILDHAVIAREGIDPTALTRHLAAASVAVVQLRCKTEGAQFFDFASRWMQALRHNAPTVKVLINDRVDVALALAADGVHVGQEDLPVAVCRHLLGPHALIGLSTHSLDEVRAGAASGADYLGFGPIFSTATKTNTAPVCGLDLLTQACRQSRLPVVAIGGIGVEALPAVYQAGATMVAMIGGLLSGDWPRRLEQAVTGWENAKG